jgi:hypothetical protein
MRILYGVVGEGMGHAIRSRVVLEHLVSQGHVIEIMASDRAVDFLRKHFPEVHRTHGLLLRGEILSTERTRGDHLLVYQTAEGHERLPEALAAAGLPCRVYGMRRALSEDVQEGRASLPSFPRAAIHRGPRERPGGVAGGGFTLMSECVYLHKPMLFVPVAGQLEQVLNARYLQRAGYGRTAEHVDAAALREFVRALPGFEAQLEGYVQDGNRAAFAALDGLLDRAAMGLL